MSQKSLIFFNFFTKIVSLVDYSDKYMKLIFLNIVMIMFNTQVFILNASVIGQFCVLLTLIYFFSFLHGWTSFHLFFIFIKYSKDKLCKLSNYLRFLNFFHIWSVGLYDFPLNSNTHPKKNIMNLIIEELPLVLRNNKTYRYCMDNFLTLVY